MIEIKFSQEEIKQLEYERYHYPHPMVKKRMEALFLKSQGYKHKDICIICSISKTTLITYLRDYQDGNIYALKQLRYKGQSSKMNIHTTSLEAYFLEHPPRNIAEAQSVIAEQTGIKRSPTPILST